jgi:hypothetical protein
MFSRKDIAPECITSGEDKEQDRLSIAPIFQTLGLSSQDTNTNGEATVL